MRTLTRLLLVLAALCSPLLAAAQDSSFSIVGGGGGSIPTPVSGANGGTGVANTGKTLTLGGNITFTGAFASAFTVPGAYTYTLPGLTTTLAAQSGSLTNGNVTVSNAQGQIIDGGVAPLTSMSQYTLWGRMSSGAGAPAEISTILLGDGLSSAPTYSFNASAGTGVYSPASNQLGLAAGGNRILNLRSGDATSYFEMIYSGAGILRMQGGTNAALRIAANGTGSVYVDSNGSGTNATMGRFIGPATAGNAVNYMAFTVGDGTGNGPKISPIAGGTGDTNIDLLFAPLGNGLLKIANSTSFAANGSVATSLGSVGPTGSHTSVQKWLTIKDQAGTTLYIPAF